MRLGSIARLPAARQWWQATVGEGAAAVQGRPLRFALTALGVAVGVAAFVTTIGLTATASAQITSRFDRLRATEVVAVDQEPERPGGLTEEALDQVRSLAGVHAAGRWWAVSGESTVEVSRFPGGQEQRLAVYAVDGGAAEALRHTLVEPEIGTGGAGLQAWHHQHGASVAVLGAAAAEQLGILGMPGRHTVWVAGEPLAVVGILEDSARRPEMLLGVVVPAGYADREPWGPPEPGLVPQLLIETAPGAAEQVGRQVPIALSPDQPGRFQVTVPPDPKTLRQEVQSDLTTMLLIMSGISLAIGAIGIANTSLISVLERSPEIGLRRALGAQRHHVAAQFVAESAFVGSLGGIVGLVVATLVVATVSVWQQWTMAVPGYVAVIATPLGTLTGTIAGIYPAIRAARIQPLEALRA